MIYQHMHGLRPMNLKHARAYAVGLKCQLADISPRLAAEAASYVSGTNATLPAPSGGGSGGPSTLQPILAWEHESDLPPGEFVMVPRLNVVLSAGNGHEQIEIEFVKHQPQAFRADWIRRERLKPSKLASMNAQGDSMEPVIFHDDALIVDTSQTAVSDGKVYAIWYEGGERVKRLYRLPGGGLRIKSDNPAYDPIELRGEDAELVRVIGRVVHRAGNAGL